MAPRANSGGSATKSSNTGSDGATFGYDVLELDRKNFPSLSDSEWMELLDHHGAIDSQSRALQSSRYNADGRTTARDRSGSSENGLVYDRYPQVSMRSTSHSSEEVQEHASNTETSGNTKAENAGNTQGEDSTKTSSNADNAGTGEEGRDVLKRRKLDGGLVVQKAGRNWTAINRVPSGIRVSPTSSGPAIDVRNATAISYANDGAARKAMLQSEELNILTARKIDHKSSRLADYNPWSAFNLPEAGADGIALGIDLGEDDDVDMMEPEVLHVRSPGRDTPMGHHQKCIAARSTATSGSDCAECTRHMALQMLAELEQVTYGGPCNYF